MKVKAEAGVMLPQVKKSLGLPAAGGPKEGSSWGGCMGAWHSHPLTSACQPPDGETTLAAVLNHPVGGTPLEQPQEATTGEYTPGPLAALSTPNFDLIVLSAPQSVRLSGHSSKSWKMFNFPTINPQVRLRLP